MRHLSVFQGGLGRACAGIGCLVRRAAGKRVRQAMGHLTTSQPPRPVRGCAEAAHDTTPPAAILGRDPPYSYRSHLPPDLRPGSSALFAKDSLHWPLSPAYDARLKLQLPVRRRCPTTPFHVDKLRDSDPLRPSHAYHSVRRRQADGQADRPQGFQQDPCRRRREALHRLPQQAAMDLHRLTRRCRSGQRPRGTHLLDQAG